MPRLVGKQSNAGLYAGLISLTAIVVAGAVAMEYFGVINEVPGFGRNQKSIGQVESPIETSTSSDASEV
jgi:hypothetical protein